MLERIRLYLEAILPETLAQRVTAYAIGFWVTLLLVSWYIQLSR